MAHRIHDAAEALASAPRWDVTVGGEKIARSSIRFVLIVAGAKHALSITLVVKDRAYCVTSDSDDWAHVSLFARDFETVGRKKIEVNREVIGRSQYTVKTIRRAAESSRNVE